MRWRVTWWWLLLTPALAAADTPWPSLAEPPPSVGGGERDAALVIGIADYPMLKQPIPGADRNARAWYLWLTETRRIETDRVTLLIDAQAVREEILARARETAARVKPGGTLWVVFVGHGAPAADGSDGVLIGADAQQTPRLLYSRSVTQTELRQALSGGRAATRILVLDSCFSGRVSAHGRVSEGLQPTLLADRAAMAPRGYTVMTAGTSEQFAGPLPGSARPAFSYLFLGALRGWGDNNGDAVVTAREAVGYAKHALASLGGATGRTQTPQLLGSGDVTLARRAREHGPKLSRLVASLSTGRGKAVGNKGPFSLSAPAPVPAPEAPAALVPAGPMEFRDVDVAALERYSEVLRFDKGSAAPKDKASRWAEYAKRPGPFRKIARERAAEWARYAEAVARREAAERKRVEARERDWDKLRRLLELPEEVVSLEQKRTWCAQFVSTYGDGPPANPHTPDLAPFLPPGSVSSRYGAMRRVPAGKFTMGEDLESSSASPAHVVWLDAFEIDATKVTVEAYRRCVTAGACTKPDETSSFHKDGRDQYAVSAVTWDQAVGFCAWQNKRLPTEAEWEKAARGTDGRRYPWGNEKPTCDHVSSTPGDGNQVDLRPKCQTTVGPVALRPLGASPYGVLGLVDHPNEWVADWYDKRYYQRSPKRNPTGPAVGPVPENSVASVPVRSVRGGHSCYRTSAETSSTLPLATMACRISMDFRRGPGFVVPGRFRELQRALNHRHAGLADGALGLDFERGAFGEAAHAGQINRR